MVVAWVYCIHLNTYRLRTLGAFAQSKYRLQGYAVCFTSTGIRYDNVSAAVIGSGDVVEDAGNGIDLIRAITSKCENRWKATIGLILTGSVYKESL